MTISTVSGAGLALTDQQDWWNDKQLAALRQLGVDKASNGDLAVFMHVAQKTGLDPFARQIYLIERQGKQTIQTGIDGFRLVARRAVDHTGETLSISGGEWCGADGIWRDVWLDAAPPAAARVTITRGGQEFVGVALWREYAQTKRDGGLTSMWSSRPAGQLAKCAEALGLRKAFPMDLAGIYTDDEMAKAEQRPVPAATSAAGRDRMAAVLGQEPTVETVADADVEMLPSESPVLDLRSALAKRMFAGLNDLGIPDDRQHEWLGTVLGRPIASRKDLTEADASRVIDECESLLAAPFDEPKGDGQ